MSAPANFAANLAAYMRASGITCKELAEKSGVGRPALGTALKGEASPRRIALDTAERITDACGASLPEWLAPFECATCHGQPPAGFTCDTCTTKGSQP